jgi:hypothetical protein
MGASIAAVAPRFGTVEAGIADVERRFGTVEAWIRTSSVVSGRWCPGSRRSSLGAKHGRPDCGGRASFRDGGGLDRGGRASARNTGSLSGGGRPAARNGRGSARRTGAAAGTDKVPHDARDPRRERTRLRKTHATLGVEQSRRGEVHSTRCAKRTRLGRKRRPHCGRPTMLLRTAMALAGLQRGGMIVQPGHRPCPPSVGSEDRCIRQLPRSLAGCSSWSA